MSLIRKQVKVLWDHYDKDRNGFLEGKELDSFLKDLCDVDELKGQEDTVRSLMDVNGDGKLDFEELMGALES